MSSKTIITSTCLRYIIPFTYSVDFDKACILVDSQQEEFLKAPEGCRKLWNRCTVSQDCPESDLYDYIRDEFLFSDGEKLQDGSKTGARWIYWSSRESESKVRDAIEELKFIDPLQLKGFAGASEEKQRSIFRDALRLKITNLGLFLFRNGLGMVWYELEPQTQTKSLDSMQLVQMQNLIKELNRANATYLWRSGKGKLPEYPVIYEKDKNGFNQYYEPFSMGKWVADKTEFLTKKYLVDRKSAWPSLMKSFGKILKSSKLPVSNLTEGAMSEKGCRDRFMPDKAILFSYCTFLEEPYVKAVPLNENTSYSPPKEEASGSGDDSGLKCIQRCEQDREMTEKKRLQLAYNLTNGYTDAYDCSPEIFRDMRQPFANAIWYATSEGAGYYKWTDERNRNTFESVIRTKASTDYFSLYVKTLYQSCTLMLLAKQIQDEIPAERIDEMDDAGYEKIGRKYEEVSQFLTRSIVTSVSHIHHQNEYFIYLKKQLRIEADARSVSTGLEALDALQKEQEKQPH